jgi:hypothetical protein
VGGGEWVQKILAVFHDHLEEGLQVGRPAGPCRRSLGVTPDCPGVDQLQRVTGPTEDLGVAERDFPLLAWLDGKDPGTKQTLTRQFDQGRVRSAPYDFLIDPPGLLGVHDLSPQLGVPLEQGEALKDRLARERVEVVPLCHPGARVPEPFGHFDERDPAVYPGPDFAPGLHHVHAPHVQRRLDPPLGLDAGGRQCRHRH